MKFNVLKSILKFFKWFLDSTLFASKYNKIYLNSIVSNLPHFLFWKNTEGTFLGCNKKFSDSIYLANPEEIVGKTDFDMPWRNSADIYIEDDKAIMATGIPKLNYEEYQRQADGTEKLMLVSKVPMLDKNQKIIGILGIYTDISERKEMERMLQKAKENAEIANQLKSEFIDNMEHDIRTPFTGIWSLASYLEARELDLQKREYLNDISKSAKQLLDYCDSILDVMKAEALATALIKEAFNLKTLVESVILMEVPYIKVKKLQMIFEYADTIPKVVIQDPNRLKRLLINLISNSVKYTEAGHIKVKVGLVSMPTSDSVVLEIQVEDTGPGLPTEKENYMRTPVISPFLSTRQGNETSGLGLRLVKQIISELEGEIDVVSKAGLGTLFKCKLPFALPEEATLVEDFKKAQ